MNRIILGILTIILLCTGCNQNDINTNLSESIESNEPTSIMKEGKEDEVKILYKETSRFSIKKGWLKATYVDDEVQYLCGFFPGESFNYIKEYSFFDNKVMLSCTTVDFEKPSTENVTFTRYLIMKDTLYMYTENDDKIVTLSADERDQIYTDIVRLIDEVNR